MTDIARLIEALQKNGMRLATAESCTGGMVAAAVTSVPGASEVFDCGVVSYSNEIKAKLLSVPEDILAQYGAVSHQTACAMAEGVRKLASADIALSTTGIAGPGGGTVEKPVGLVYIGLADKNGVRSTENRFSGDRNAVREQTVQTAFRMLDEYMIKNGIIQG